MWSITISIFILFSIDFIRGQLSPDISNVTGDYYTLIASATSPSQPQITCTNSEGCYVSCSGNYNNKGSCNTATINAASADWLVLNCDGKETCKSLFIETGPSLSANITCKGEGACYQANIILSETNEVQIECNRLGQGSSTTYSDGACYGSTITATNADNVYIDCKDTNDCYSAKIYGANSGSLRISCNAGSACYSMDVWPPYLTEYAFYLFCSSTEYSCRYIDVKVPDSTKLPNNYMELICSKISTRTGICDIRYYCDNIGTSSATSVTWSSSNGRYQCNDQDCCPWASGDDMSKPPTSKPTDSPTPAPTSNPTAPTAIPSASPTDATSAPTSKPTDNPTIGTSEPTLSPTKMPSSNPSKHPTGIPTTSEPTNNPTTRQPTTSPTDKYIAGSAWDGYTLFIRGFNIWSVETSGSALLDINFFEANIEGYTNEGSTCSLSSLEFDSSFSSYSSYSYSDSVSIEAGYSAGAGGAGGGYSRERTETKSYAAKAQTYIYTLNLECKKAQATLNAFNKVYWSSNFVNNLRTLPSPFIESNIDDYDDFFNTFGTHVIQNGKLGGSIRGAITVDKCSVSNSYSSSDSYQVCLNAAYKGATAAGCYGESESESSGLSVSNSITNQRIIMRGGSTSTFTETFNSFGDKSNDFQSWIDTLSDNPDIVGGNLVEIHEALEDAIILGDHKLNVASDVVLTDDQWKEKLTALGQAYQAKSAQIVVDDDDLNTECQVSCGEGSLDRTKCVCNQCSESNNCCVQNNTDAANIINPYFLFLVCFINFCVTNF